MKTLTEWMQSPEEHPFHKTAVNNGFHHENSSSAAHVSTHTYSHPQGHSLKLHTSNGIHSFNMKTRSGQEKTGRTSMLLHGAALQAN